MRLHIRLLGILMTLCLFVGTPRSFAAQTIKDRYDAVSRRLAAVDKSAKADDVLRIDTDIDTLPLLPKSSPDWRDWRRAKLELWLQAIALIDKLGDPSFDPKDRPMMNIAPPRESGLPAGVSPDAIKDPKLRAEYEKAIQANAEKAERYHLQHWIRKLDSMWTEKIRVFIVGQYSHEIKDLHEVDSLINRLVSSDSKKQQLRGFNRQR